MLPASSSPDLSTRSVTEIEKIANAILLDPMRTTKVLQKFATGNRKPGDKIPKSLENAEAWEQRMQRAVQLIRATKRNSSVPNSKKPKLIPAKSVKHLKALVHEDDGVKVKQTPKKLVLAKSNSNNLEVQILSELKEVYGRGWGIWGRSWDPDGADAMADVSIDEIANVAWNNGGKSTKLNSQRSVSSQITNPMLPAVTTKSGLNSSSPVSTLHASPVVVTSSATPAAPSVTALASIPLNTSVTPIPTPIGTHIDATGLDAQPSVPSVLPRTLLPTVVASLRADKLSNLAKKKRSLKSKLSKLIKSINPETGDVIVQRQGRFKRLMKRKLVRRKAQDK
jgi:hypothetical protein